MFNKVITTDSLVKPLQSLVDKLTQHIAVSKQAITGYNESITQLQQQINTTAVDVAKAEKVTANLQKILA